MGGGIVARLLKRSKGFTLADLACVLTAVAFLRQLGPLRVNRGGREREFMLPQGMNRL
jgi:hypothetical protein